MNIFKYSHYLTYLKDYLTKEASQRGLYAKISKEAGIHPSYLSRILSGSTHLTPEQAAGLCHCWHFNPNETRYYLNLVHLARAGTPLLRNLIQTELDELKNEQEDLSPRLKADLINTQIENIYYSAWYYSAVHILLTVPQMHNETAISKQLNLSETVVKNTLHTLAELGLIQKQQNKWVVIKSNVHLGQHSWMTSIHHINWRTKMAERLQFQTTDELHYTGLHTLSKDDFRKIKNILLDSLVSVDAQVRPSKEEVMGCLLIDWVKL